MNKTALLPLALILVAASFTGCAHQTTRTGSKTNVLGGLVTVERGAYQPASATSVDINTNDMVGNSGKVSGTQVNLGWGAISATDY